MTKRKISIANDVANRARECLFALLENSQASDVLKDNVDNYRNIQYGISSAGNAHSRQTLMEMPIKDILSLSHGTSISDEGLPEIVVELSSHEGETALKVVKTKNINLAASFRDQVDSMPVYMTMNGPQNLPGTGIFALMDDTHIPGIIVSHDGSIAVHTPHMAVTSENIGMDREEAAEIAAAIDGIISIGTNTPAHKVSEHCASLSKARSWALKAEDKGDLIIGMPDSLIFERASRIAVPSAPTQEISRTAGVGRDL